MEGWKIPESMKLACIWVVWCFLAIGALGWTVMVVIEAVGPIDAPDWVQAIGSVAAIVAAIFIANADRRSARSDSRRRELVILCAVHNAAQDAVSAMWFLDEGLRKYYRPITEDSPADIRERIEFIDSAIRSLKGIDLMQMPFPEVVEALIQLKALLEYCRTSAVKGRNPENDIKAANFSPFEFHLKLASEQVHIIGSRMR